LTVGGRYGCLFDRLPDLWCALLKREALNSAVVEDLDRAEGDRLVGLAVSVFVTDDFVQQAKTHPLFWIGPDLIRRMTQNESPILERGAIRRGNSREGLNLFLWEPDIRVTTPAEFFPIAAEMGQAATEYHAGFSIKEALGQWPSGPVFRLAAEFAGWFAVERNGQYTPLRDADGCGLSEGPYVLGLTREIAREHPGLALSAIFHYQPPRLFLTCAQQRLLKAALAGDTDEQIAGGLGISLSAVKKCWLAVYAKVSLRAPELLPDDGCNGSSGTGRGTEKRRRLLAYLQTRPEELRPHTP
jgi:hypothetical protein